MHVIAREAITPHLVSITLGTLYQRRYCNAIDWRSGNLVQFIAVTILFGLGAWLEYAMPEWQTNGWQMVVWGFVISTIVLYHATFTINSLAHRFGSRRYATRDSSRNNAWLALLTFGEGWHNNHHFFPGSARQGFRWWEIDLTYYTLRAMALFRLVHDLKPVPAWVAAKARPR